MEEKSRKLFTSEHVAPGHPDKVCDCISDSILDYHYSHAPKLTTRVAVETLAKDGKVVLAGEITSPVVVDYPRLVQDTLKELGYIPEVSPKFNSNDVDVQMILTEQSPDIAACVDRSEIGAGDQGIMFGYAVSEAPDLTGWAHYISRQLVAELWQAKQANDSTGQYSICPDYKVQVTMDYSGEMPSVDTVLVSVSHTHETNFEDLKRYVTKLVQVTLEEIHSDSVKIGREISIESYQLMVNPYGPFTVFGPVADSGLTGRKIVCDQYGGYAPVGGGAFSGKDLTKVDRTAAYMARYVAKNILTACNCNSSLVPEELTEKGLFRDCSVEVAYVIGQAEPVSIQAVLRTEEGKSIQVDSEVISELLGESAYQAFKPESIIDRLKLFTVDFSEVAKFGHIGVDSMSIRKPWEALI